MAWHDKWAPFEGDDEKGNSRRLPVLRHADFPLIFANAA
jgi:hypothetical protein